MTEFSRRGLLGTFLAAPFLKVFKVGPIQAKIPRPQVEVGCLWPTESFEICLLNSNGDPITDRLPVSHSGTDGLPEVVFPRDLRVKDLATGYRLYLPGEFKELIGKPYLDHDFSHYCLNARLDNGDVSLHFDHGGLIQFDDLPSISNEEWNQ